MHHSHNTLDQLQTFKMEALKQFPREYAKSFQSSFDFLNILNVRYLQDDESFVKKYWRFLYIVPAVWVHLLSLTAHIAILLSKGQMMDVAYTLPPYLVSIHSSLKALVLIPKTTQISTIIRELGGLWRTKLTEEQSIEKNRLLKRLNFCNGVSYWVAVLGTSQYMVSPLLETLYRRYILRQDCEFLLPLAATYPVDPYHNWLLYTTVYCFQCYIMTIIVCFYVGSELIMITLCGLLSAEFLMLKDDLSQAEPTKKIRNDVHIEEHSINEFVKRHQKLIMLSRQLDNVFNRMIFIDLLFIGITTCAFNFAGQFARGPTYTINNYIAVAASLSTVLYLCYYGEVLMGASARLGDVAYQNLWYKGDSHYIKSIWLIIKISQKPCCLTSLRYAVVSLQLFTTVMSTTWSYFSLMNSVYTFEEKDATEAGF